MNCTQAYEALLLRSDDSKKVEDVLTVEHPLSIRINGEPFTLTMQTPGNERELIRGLLFTEGVFKERSGGLNFAEVERSENGFLSVVDVRLDPDKIDFNRVNKRNLLSVASCGICGKTELELPKGERLNAGAHISLPEIQEMFASMQSGQHAFLSSGGCHASAAFSVDRKLLYTMEDIGRHNAVDKVIGAALLEGTLGKVRYLLVSGRVSYEIVTKCFLAGIPFLLAVSAPSSLAVDFSKELGVTLIAFCRDDRATIYSGAERLLVV